jgi:hypothetical protein
MGRTHKRTSYAVVLGADALEEQFWKDKNVEMLSVRLDEYVAGLSDYLVSLPIRAPA